MINTDFTIRSFKGGYDDNFQYILTCMQSRAQIAIDAALPLNTLRPFLNGAFVAMLITHTHGDHIAFIDEYLEEFPELLIIIHEESSGRISAVNVHPTQDEEQIQIGQLNIDILHTPGHFPDSSCYKLENVIFTGDTLFVGRTGRTISQGSDTGELYQSVYSKLLTLPQDTIIYPGHDYGKTPTISIKKNIEVSPLLQAANEQDFIERMAAFEASRKQPL
ncbi:MAG TPA: MBL fold metallo-hydrolase [Candidatus Marinimicrobia bacterium]|jgi:glyoxylase-like metal-dependent hydrolase (beta-lactamase superfamily II)|nr:Zn-dependent hydrolase [Candidatus Neomarinimicrobiota bacterium]MDP7216680.1 MBL fold metallo-hydrolase [Candidatus Neomarinimicrobiota bacterium]HBN45666.1 Zn-dependent hydrolase [Candidatus Neomarinimicrobiota bacterium]HJL74514.1 MBL fold metallo-hydrolase [Candidatus Neomarinimicrobiota bacterium]HJM70626.1 MBL fold metallo-hydrolase [Candidatus Neomarinimicrobiota bacterium]|tara:strand:- start:315 stop:974 length:660 start_codon:yes stop_codon:yes gene_type:complete